MECFRTRVRFPPPPPFFVRRSDDAARPAPGRVQGAAVASLSISAESRGPSTWTNCALVAGDHHVVRFVLESLAYRGVSPLVTAGLARNAFSARPTCT